MNVVWLGKAIAESTWEPKDNLPDLLVTEYETGIFREIQRERLTSGGHTVYTLSTNAVDPSAKRQRTDTADYTSTHSGSAGIESTHRGALFELVLLHVEFFTLAKLAVHQGDHLEHAYSETCVSGHLSRAVTSLFQPARTGPKLKPCIHGATLLLATCCKQHVSPCVVPESVACNMLQDVAWNREALYSKQHVAPPQQRFPRRY